MSGSLNVRDEIAQLCRKCGGGGRGGDPGAWENLKISLSGAILLGLFSNLCCFECKHVFLLRTYIFFFVALKQQHLN